MDRNVGRSMRWPLANASPKHGRVEDNGEGRRGVYEGGGRFIGDTALNRQSQSDFPLNPSPFSPAPQVNESRAHNASVDRSIRDNGPGRGWHGSFTLPPAHAKITFPFHGRGETLDAPSLVAQANHVFAKMTHFLHRLILCFFEKTELWRSKSSRSLRSEQRSFESSCTRGEVGAGR